MRKLHLLVLKSFTGPFAASLSVSLFILIIQLLYSYQDILAGKKISFSILSQLVFYSSASLLLLAAPLALLLSSLMTMGKLGEQYELAAVKSAGISVWRLSYPLYGLGVVVFGFLIWVSFFLVPSANLKFYSLLWDIQQTKPDFALVPGHFYNGISGYSMRISSKNENTNMLYGLMVYDHTEDRGNVASLIADSAKMTFNPEDKLLTLNMYNGIRYDDLKPEQGKPDRFQFTRYKFDSVQYHFDMSDFGFLRTDESKFAPHHLMLNLGQLISAIDSMKTINDSVIADLKTSYFKPFLNIESIQESGNKVFISSKVQEDLLKTYPLDQQYEIISRAMNTARGMKNYAEYTVKRSSEESEMLRQYQIRLQSKLAQPISCLIFLLIGAPLGAIIRKGGVGTPMVISIGFFILYYVLMTQGEKLAKEAVISVTAGVFLPVYTLLPIAIWISYKSSIDSALFDSSLWYKGFKGILNLFNKK